MDLSLLY